MGALGILGEIERAGILYEAAAAAGGQRSEQLQVGRHDAEAVVSLLRPDGCLFRLAATITEPLFPISATVAVPDGRQGSGQRRLGGVQFVWLYLVSYATRLAAVHASLPASAPAQGRAGVRDAIVPAAILGATYERLLLKYLDFLFGNAPPPKDVEVALAQQADDQARLGALNRAANQSSSFFSALTGADSSTSHAPQSPGGAAASVVPSALLSTEEAMYLDALQRQHDALKAHYGRDRCAEREECVEIAVWQWLRVPTDVLRGGQQQRGGGPSAGAHHQPSTSHRRGVAVTSWTPTTSLRSCLQRVPTSCAPSELWTELARWRASLAPPSAALSLGLSPVLVAASAVLVRYTVDEFARLGEERAFPTLRAALDDPASKSALPSSLQGSKLWQSVTSHVPGVSAGQTLPPSTALPGGGVLPLDPFFTRATLHTVMPHLATYLSHAVAAFPTSASAPPLPLLALVHLWSTAVTPWSSAFWAKTKVGHTLDSRAAKQAAATRRRLGTPGTPGTPSTPGAARQPATPRGADRTRSGTTEDSPDPFAAYVDAALPLFLSLPPLFLTLAVSVGVREADGQACAARVLGVLSGRPGLADLLRASSEARAAGDTNSDILCWGTEVDMLARRMALAHAAAATDAGTPASAATGGGSAGGGTASVSTWLTSVTESLSLPGTSSDRLTVSGRDLAALARLTTKAFGLPPLTVDEIEEERARERRGNAGGGSGGTAGALVGSAASSSSSSSSSVVRGTALPGAGGPASRRLAPTLTAADLVAACDARVRPIESTEIASLVRLLLLLDNKLRSSGLVSPSSDVSLRPLATRSNLFFLLTCLATLYLALTM